MGAEAGEEKGQDGVGGADEGCEEWAGAGEGGWGREAGGGREGQDVVFGDLWLGQSGWV